MPSKSSSVPPGLLKLVEYTPGEQTSTAVHRGTNLPVEVWKGLFIVALKRLEKCKPRWGKKTLEDLRDVALAWRFRGFYRDMAAGRGWLDEALRFLEESEPPGRGRMRVAASADGLLKKYELLLEGLQGVKRIQRKARLKNADEFYAVCLSALLVPLGPFVRNSGQTYVLVEKKVTPRMIRVARHESPSEAAMQIIGELSGRSPDALKQEFVKARRSRSPLQR